MAEATKAIKLEDINFNLNKQHRKLVKEASGSEQDFDIQIPDPNQGDIRLSTFMIKPAYYCRKFNLYAMFDLKQQEIEFIKNIPLHKLAS